LTGTLENIYHEDTGQRLKKQFLNLVAINEEEISETVESYCFWDFFFFDIY